MSDFREEIMEALGQGAGYQQLLAIVLQHKARGLSQEAAYSKLQRIHSELGCDGDDCCSSCELLEGIMDRVWGYCPAYESIWGSSLSSNQSQPHGADIPSNS